MTITRHLLMTKHMSIIRHMRITSEETDNGIRPFTQQGYMGIIKQISVNETYPIEKTYITDINFGHIP